MLDTFLFICEVVILGLDDLLSPLGPVLRGLLIVTPLVLIALGVPMRVIRCILAAVGHLIKIGGRSARTMAIPLILFCGLFFVAVGLVSARCVSSGTTMICGDGGICDMDTLANTEHLYLNGKINNPTSEAVLRYLPKLKVSPFPNFFSEIIYNFSCNFKSVLFEVSLKFLVNTSVF